jgi:hypothetical protein
MEKLCPHMKNKSIQDDKSTDLSETTNNNKKDCPFTKIIKFFGKQFIKFFLIRFSLSLVEKILKVRFNIFKISLSDIFNSFFKMGNFQTGLFLSLMPSLFKLLILILKNSKFSGSLDERIITFISGFISSLIGIFISEKVSILNFIILSVMVRTLHSWLVVWLKKSGYPIHNRFAGFLVLNLACAIALVIYFYYPSFKPITKLIDRYALFTGNEKEELYAMRDIIRVDKN